MDAFAGENVIYQFGNFEIESGRRILRSRHSGAVVPLTPRAFDLLLLLVRRPNVLIGKDELIAALWPDVVVEDNNLEQAVFTLRQTLGERRGEHRYIKTIHRRGYQFTATVAVVAAAPPTFPVDVPADLPAESPAPRPTKRRIAVFATTGAIALIVALAMLLLRDPATRAPVSSVPPPAIGTLAVRYFRPVVDDERGLLSDTITMLLEQRFAGITGLPVIAPESTRAAIRREASAAEFGRRLNARFVLSGDVARSDQRIRLSATLTDSSSDKTLWSLTFDRPVAELTAIREEIVARSVAAMHVTEAVADAAVKAPINLDAWEVWMRGQRLMSAGATAGDTDKAIVMFTRATVLDPRFARAYFGVADSLLYSHSLKPHLADTPLSDAEGADEVQVALDRALELNPALGEAWIYKARFIADPAEADRMFRHGLQLKPNYSVGSMFYSQFLMEHGRAGEAIDIIDRARRLDPMSPMLLWLQSDALMISRSDVAGSERLLRQALDMEGGVGAASALAKSLASRGQFAESMRLLQRSPDQGNTRAQVAWLYLDLDDVEAADRWWKGADPPPAFQLMVISQYRRDTRGAAQMGRNMLGAQREDLYNIAAQSIRDDALTTGDMAAALRTLEPAYAGHQSHRTMPTADHEFSIVFAHVLILAGQVERGRKLARALLVSLDGDEIGRPAQWFSRERAQLFAMLGEDDKAIDELAASQRLNLWSRWWYTGEIDPVFAHLRQDPRFVALAGRARAQRAAQRALLEDMRHRGEVR